VICSGGDPRNRGTTEAKVMSKQLEEEEGVPKNSIHMEATSANTVQNALNVLKMVGAGCQKLHLVTSDFHMPRCAYVYEAVLKSQNREDITLVRHPVSEGCPTESKLGDELLDGAVGARLLRVNDMTKLERLQFERYLLANEEDYLKKDSPKGVTVEPLPKARLTAAQKEVDDMIEEEQERKQSGAPRPSFGFILSAVFVGQNFLHLLTTKCT